MSRTGHDAIASAARLRRTFFVAFALCVLAFISSSLVLRRQSKTIGATAISLATNGGPSTRLLANMRTTLRHREVALDDFIDALPAAPRTPGDAAIDLPPSEAPDRARMIATIQAYLSLPLYPGEREMQPLLVRSLAELNASLDRVAAEVRAGRPAEAERVMNVRTKPAFDNLDKALQALTELNGRASMQDAARIAAVHHQVTRLGALLDLACAFFTLCAGYFAFRVVQQDAALMRRQISELELYSSRLAHDVRGPLTSVKLAVDLAARSMEASKTRDMLERASRIVLRVSELMDGLLMLASVNAPQDRTGTASVPVVFADLRAELLPAAHAYEIELEMPEPPACAVACTPGILVNLVNNLAGNAFKYMGQSAVRRVMIRAAPSRDAVRIEVEDTGPGIPRSFQPQMFRPFARVPTTGVFGLGLGLATVQRLTQALGGAVGFESLQGQGTLFWIELPRRRAPAGEDPPAPQAT